MEAKADTSQGVLETALSDLVRQAVRAEVQDIMRSIRDEDRLLTIEEVAERLSVSKDWVPEREEIKFHEKTRTEADSIF
jgi:hypothetical protein